MLNAKLTIKRATSGIRVSGVMDSYAPQRNEMRRAEWEWRYSGQRETPPPVETGKDMRAVVAAILARRCC